MDLSTSYLGLKLRTPLVPSASPLSQDVANVKRMEDAGASAVVFHSLFEEQIRLEEQELHHHLTEHADSFAEALSFFPEADEYRVGPEDYLEHLRRAKEQTKIPIIASLNGSATGQWIQYAKLMQEAGADALELNIYAIPSDMEATSAEVESSYLEIFRQIKSIVKVPVAVKLSPFFTNLSNFAKKLDEAGADGLVLFNRFYQPDFDLEELVVKNDLNLSTSHSLRLPLRWISILFGRVKADLAATGGIHHGEDAIKMIMAGARVTMLCSVLMMRGISFIKTIEQKMAEWLEAHEYESVQQMCGSMSQVRCDDPSAFERAQYIRVLQSYRPKV
ncbi:MAG: dihydroorotate dehydrogenase-like protein [Candidatus Omnitrophota bacterium]